jgi:hypothetical protein
MSQALDPNPRDEARGRLLEMQSVPALKAYPTEFGIIELPFFAFYWEPAGDEAPGMMDNRVLSMLNPYEPHELLHVTPIRPPRLLIADVRKSLDGELGVGLSKMVPPIQVSSADGVPLTVSLLKALTTPFPPRSRRLPRCGRITGTRNVSENSERSPLGNGGRPWQGMSPIPTNLRASDCPAHSSCAWHKGCPAQWRGRMKE